MISLNCLNCAAPLEISPDMTIFACGHCGSQQLVERSGGTVALKSVTNAINRVQIGTDKTAAELALKRLEKEVRELGEQRGRREVLAHHELERKKKAGIWMGVGGLVVGLIVGIKIGADVFTPFLGLIGMVVGLAIGISMKNKKDKVIKEKTREDLDAFDYHITTVRRKMESHRRIAES